MARSRIISWITASIVLFAFAGVTSLALPVSAATTIEQIGTDIDGEATLDRSGFSVASNSDGSIIAIGAPYNEGNGTNAGQVRVYTWIGTAWTQRGADIDGEAAGDNSGWSVALSDDGSTLAVGAINNDGNGSNSGHVRVYTCLATCSAGGAWTQLGTDIDGETVNNQSGYSVSMNSDGTILAVGANINDGGGNDSGHVRVYAWSGTNWTQLGADIDGEAANSRSGSSVSLSTDGTTVAIGAPNNSGNGNEAGHTRVYAWNGSVWTQRGADIDGEAAGDLSGYSVSLSADGHSIAIGAPWNGGNGSKAGHVRFFTWNGNVWTQRGADIDGEDAGDTLGHAVSLSGDGKTVTVGAPYNDGAGSDAGHVRSFSWTSSAWIQRGTDIDGEVMLDQSGFSVASSGDGDIVIVGARFNDGTGNIAGHVRAFRLTTVPAPGESAPTPTPVHRTTLDPNGGTCFDDDTSHSSPWTSVFVGYRYLPNATDCTRAGFTLTGWANLTTPTTSAALPLLVDPSDGQRRVFLAADSDLVAIWTPTLDNMTVFANFLCGPCTTIWVIHTTTPPDVTVDITIDDVPLTCNQRGDAFGLTFCEITSLSPGTHTVTATPLHRSDGRDTVGRPTSITVTLRA